jgi:hypothetical protein
MNAIILKLNFDLNMIYYDCKQAIKEVRNLNRPEIRLKPGVLEQLEKELDTNKVGLTMITGLSSSQIYRVRMGQSKIGVDFIAGLLKADHSKKFEDFFLIIY